MSYAGRYFTSGGGGTGTVTSVTGGNNITITGTPTVAPVVNVSGTTNFAVQIGNASGSLTSLALGTSGFVLTSNGAGVAPSFQAASGGITSIVPDVGGPLNGPTIDIGTVDSTTSMNCGTTVFFQGYPGSDECVLTFTDLGQNTLLGNNAGNSSTLGVQNSALGNAAMFFVGAGNDNVAIGNRAMQGNGSASSNNNVAVGSGALTDGSGSSFIGDYNVGIGYQAGSAVIDGRSSNIFINSVGVAADANTGRIGGGTGTGTRQLNRMFISGIFGITVGVSGIPVIVDNAGQVGTVVSSIRYKKNVRDMADTNVMELRPVNFTYKADKTNKKQYGLIAEEVEQIFPDLVAYNQEGTPESVKYQDLPILLLKELQSLRRDFEDYKIARS